MPHPTRPRRAIRLLAIVAATLLATMVTGIGRASAATTAISPGHLSPFTNVSYIYTDDTCGTFASPDTDTTPDQTFVTGPGTPPSGTGSLQMEDNAPGENNLFRTASYNGTNLSEFSSLQFSTFVHDAGKQPPYLRLTVDDNNDGTPDTSLFFFPADNGAQQAVTDGTWQTWNAFTGTWAINGDSGNPTTLADYSTTNPDATIIDSFTPGTTDPNEAGGFSFLYGCGGNNTAGATVNLDKVVVQLTGKSVAKYDLEATQPARTLTISPTSGKPGTTIAATGTDCFESTARVSLGQSTGESGDEVGSATATPAANGTFTGSVTVPSDSNPDATYSVVATCGPAGDPAFDYTGQAFDVLPNAPTPTGASGYRAVAADGGIFTFGDRTFHGSTGNLTLNKPIVGGATDPSSYNGYWIVASDGGVFTFNAPFFGSLAGQTLAAPAVEIEPTPSGKGYWIVLANGKVHNFGDAGHFGDMSGKGLNKPVIGMSVTPTGKGYWLVGSDGGIFNFGDAGFFGSMGASHLNAPVIDLAPAVDNNGYYLLGRDGGVFTFGSAVFKGSTGAMKLNAPVIAMLVAPNGAGYWLSGTDGGVFTFGAVGFLGSMGNVKLNAPVLDLVN